MNTTQYIKTIYTKFPLEKREIDLVLCHVLEINTAQLYIFDQKISNQNKLKIATFLSQRSEGIPLAYLTGIKSFWNLDLIVNQHTLIPRPETEQIIELVLQWTQLDFTGSILDLGTGTGAIALNIAQERPQAQLTAVDSSLHCVKIAQANQKKYNLKNVEIFQSNWFEQIAQPLFDIIVSNPPYIAPDDHHLKALAFEPITALTAEKNGLSDLYHIIEQARFRINPSGHLLLEHGYNQKQQVQSKLTENRYINIKTHKDLAGIPRITTAQIQNVAIVNQ